MSPYSLRRIAGLALPALVVLAAEPLYVLVDTAVVGHLGSRPLAALAIGGTVMSVAAWLGTVMAYGTTGRAARRYGAGDRAAAVAEGVQASWLAVAVGLTMAVVAQIAAEPLAGALAGAESDAALAGGGESEAALAGGAESGAALAGGAATQGGEAALAGVESDAAGTAESAAQWLRIAALGAPGLLLAAAGNGWMRGVQDTRRPLIYVLGANLLSAVLCPVLVYPLGMGLAGSAVANVVAQTIAGGLFVRAIIAERAALRPRPAVIRQQVVLGRDLLIRGLAFQASFLSATAVAARFGTAAVAAHQITLQLWFFCALALDAVAIAAQSLVGAALGAGEDAEARALGRRIAVIGGVCGIGFAVLVGAGAGVVPGLFSPDRAVHEQAMLAWPWFVALLPLAGVVYALDGVLIGAGDARFLRNATIFAAFGGFLPAIWLAYAFDAGLGGIWAGIALFIVARLATLLVRLRSGAWAVIGATTP